MRTEAFTQGSGGVELFARLIEVDDAQIVRALDGPRVDADLALEHPQQRGLAAAVWTREAEAKTGRQ